ncbi:hypothetical protein D9757_003992 [Collybiopsis confluens]|uniref:Small RNA 2'-O-methyltransferase n=1 Tax=Collybiopsis confluens TaxID=2823264 RepID=A0A8H5HWU1_9AGAR|nr:hypothetical protein D9757_003992 [Collybiopsis confluens]
MDGDQLGTELTVTFFPNLFLQRRIWILTVLRKQHILDVLDVGCGSGQLLSVLTTPSPWLAAPPEFLLHPASDSPLQSPVDLFNTDSDPIPNLHIRKLGGLDISAHDLQFAVQATEPPSSPTSTNLDPWKFTHTPEPIRWEDVTANIWQGDLQSINEQFVGTQAIVSSEVIEHLPPNVLPFFAPVLLGVYRPNFLLITTPSYTFNQRFTSPDSHPSVRLRSGYLDPTGRTDRIFRHEDHKFEWTPDEFKKYCEKEANEWGYAVQLGDIGRAQEIDEWGRDAEIGGASLVAKFTRIDDDPDLDRDAIELRARELVRTLTEQQSSPVSPSTPTADNPNPSLLENASENASELPVASEHRLLASHLHPAHPSSQSPLSLREIGDIIKARMEGLRESFMRIEELWYEPEISKACGGWIELLIRAVEEYDPGSLSLAKETDSSSDTASLSPMTLTPSSAIIGSASTTTTALLGSSANPEINIQRQRDLWKIGLVGSTRSHPRPLWPSTEIVEYENDDHSAEYMPMDWNPEKEYTSEYDHHEHDYNYDYGQTVVSNSGIEGNAEWEEEISGASWSSAGEGEEGDVSWGEEESEDAEVDQLDAEADTSGSKGWGSSTVEAGFAGWGEREVAVGSSWGDPEGLNGSGWSEELRQIDSLREKTLTRSGRGRSSSMPVSSSSSATGWDGDEDDSDTS